MRKKLILFVYLFVVSAIHLLAFTGKTIDLRGEWGFAIDRSDVGITEKWFNRKSEETIFLPGSMTENRKGDDITLQTKFTGSIYDSSWYFNPRMAKYRVEGNLKMPFWLTQLKHYVGLAWYRKEVVVPASWKGMQISLFLERPHFITRVWVDGKEVGTENSLCTPHIFQLNGLKPGKHLIAVRIDNRMKDVDVGQNSHSVTDHTQGNWNGMVGDLQLRATSLVSLGDIQIYPDLKGKKARVKIQIISSNGKPASGTVTLSAKSFNGEKQHIVAPLVVPFKTDGKEQFVETELPMGEGMLLWDEFNPNLYRLQASLKANKQSDMREVQFGMREMSIQGKYICVNGVKTVMRGTVENCQFPLTGYPAMDEAAWQRIFRICKSYGLNHMRFHSYCPPEAAFIAADKVGFYLQPEGPSWPNHSTRLGMGLPIDNYLMEETKRITRAYGNFASFTFLSAGNEPSGRWVPWVSKFVDYWKATDNRRLYTGASVGNGWAWQPKNQYHVKAGARGLSWNNGRPESMADYRSRIDTVKEPYISHETGQWCAFPDFDEIKKYTGVTRAKNFELFKEDLADSDMADLSHEFLIASGKLQLLCYKHEIEKTLRTPDYAGFQLLCLNDFSGQGTALVGVLNSFWQEKGYVTAPEFRRFCNSTVLLARIPKFVYHNNEPLNAKVEVAHWGKTPLSRAKTIWRIRDAYGLTLAKGELSTKDIPVGNNFNLGEVNIDLTRFDAPTKLNFEVAIEGTEIANDWNFWVYPQMRQPIDTSDIYICRGNLDAKAVKTLSAGGKVLVLAAGKITYGKDVAQHYQPAFWNTSWFKMRPPHTTGVFIRQNHPVFENFVTDSWGDMQWWELINRSQVMLLTDFPKGFQPIVQPIDTWFINRKIGMLIEACVGNGKLMMTSADLSTDLAGRPVAESLYNSIVKYMQSDKFRPEYKVDEKVIRDLFEKTAAPINMYSKSNPDELKKGVK